MTLGWRLRDVAAAVGGDLIGDDRPVESVGTDSRAVTVGELFVAMAGETFDGHDYTDHALSAGASGVLVNRGRGVATLPRIEVADTQRALLALAVRQRELITAQVVAVTGSTGKTTTKDLLAASLPGAWASPRSFNNEVGVPLTLLGTPRDAPFLVAEVGSRGVGHIAHLMPAVRPDVAIITNLGLVHLETFGSTERLADAKWELVAALGSDGVAVLPVDEPRLAREHAGTTVTFGCDQGADVTCHSVELDARGYPTFGLRTAAGEIVVRLRLAGRHQALNAAAATAAALACGVPLDVVAEGLQAATGSAWRMEVHEGRFTVVNDAYNANPDSVAAALETVAAMEGRHVAVLGKMAELGPVEALEHERIGALARDLGYRTVVMVGEDPGIVRGAGDIATSAADPDSARALLLDVVAPGDVVLVKASRAVGLEALARCLAEEATA